MAVGPLLVQVSLTAQPTAPVMAYIKIPFAWNGRLLADVYPDRMIFEPNKSDWYQTVTITPAAVTTGNYFIEVW